MTMDAPVIGGRAVDRGLVVTALALVALGALSVAAAYSPLGDLADGEAFSTCIGLASFLGVLASVALTADALRIGWRMVQRRRGRTIGDDLLRFVGLALLVDAGLSLAALPIHVGPGGGPDEGLFWVFLAIFLVVGGVLVLVADGLRGLWRSARHHGGHAPGIGSL